MRRLILFFFLISLFTAVKSENVQRDSLIHKFWAIVDDQPEEAIPLMDSAISLFPKDELSYEKAEAYFGLGYAHFEKSDYKKALPHYFESKNIFEAIKDTCYQRRVMFNIGASLSMLGDNLGASKYYLRSMELGSCEEFEFTKAVDYYNLGTLFYDLNLLAESKDNYEKAIAEDSIGMNISYRQLSKMSLSYFQYEDGDTLGATKTIKKILKQSKNDTIEWVTLFFYGYNDLSAFHLELGQLDSAKKYFEKAKKIADSLNVLDYNITIKQTHADILGREGYLSEAIDTLQSALTIAQKINFKQAELGVLSRLAYLAEEIEDYKLAFDYKNKEQRISDSIYTEKVKFNYIMQELKSRDEQIHELNDQNVIKELQLQTRNKEFIGLSIVAVLLALLLGYLNRQRKKVKKLNKRLTFFNQEKDRIMTSLSHDLRSPLTIIYGVMEMLKLKSLDDFEKKELKETLNESVDQLKHNLESLLNWALVQMKSVEASKEWLSPKEECSELKEYAKPFIDKKNQALAIEIEEKAKIYCDSGHLSLIMRNLVSNANKFSPIGSEIKVVCETMQHGVEIRVIDQGIGIDAEKLRKINREEFFKDSGTEGEKGLGLGLRLVREYVKVNDGKLSFESEEGKGTTAKIVFPLP